MNNNRNMFGENGEINVNPISWNKYCYKNCTIKNKFFRRKKWNHYLWLNEKYVFMFALVNLDYAGSIFMNFHDIVSGENIKESITVPFAKGIVIDDEIDEGVKYSKKDLYINIKRIKDKLCIDLLWKDVKAIIYIELGDESLNVLIPWSKKKYHYTSKKMSLVSSGNLFIRDKVIDLKESLLFIDYGRGIWPYEKKWYWLTTGFESNGNKIGLNLGARWTENTGVNENGIIINGKLFKLETDIKFEAIDENKKWIIKSIIGTDINLEFTPLKSTNEYHNFIFIKSNLKQYIGYLNGSILANGEEIEFRNTLTWLEDHFARW